MKAYRNCSTCHEELFTDCQGRWRCVQCDPPCPDCYDGGMDYEDDEEDPEEDE